MSFWCVAAAAAIALVLVLSLPGPRRAQRVAVHPAIWGRRTPGPRHDAQRGPGSQHRQEQDEELEIILRYATVLEGGWVLTSFAWIVEEDPVLMLMLLSPRGRRFYSGPQDWSARHVRAGFSNN